jgi:Bacterial Ig-like domain (group 3)/Chitobiase/beta-hexosaminidase C-terminal domain
LTTNGETVTFYNGGTSIGTASLSSGVATINLNPIPVGTDTLTATYSGDGNFTSASSNSITFTIAATALTLSSTANTSTYGSSITLTATLNPYSSGSFTTDGEMVTFFSNGTSFGSGTLSSGVATLAIAYLPVGTDTVTAAYGGDHNFAASTSNPLTQTVNAGSGPIPAFVVTTSTDDATGVAFNCTGAGSSDCSLRDALSAAAGAGGGNITFVPAVAGISLNVNAGGLYIPSNTTITGPAIGGGVGGLIGYSAILNVNGGVVNAAISNLTIAGNDALANGGGIYNDGQLTVTNCLITGNNGDPLYGGAGSGIFNDSSGNMKLINSNVSGNELNGPGTSNGGGILNVGMMTVINSVISNNDVSCGGGPAGCFGLYGGGIWNGGTLILTGSIIQGNKVGLTGEGGGIWNGGTMVVTNSSVTNNLADSLPPVPPLNGTAEDDCDGTGCPVNGTNGNTLGDPQNTQPAAASPVFSPRAGTYENSQPITITDTTPGAIIFYSTDSTPTWTRYTGPVTIGSTGILAAIAVAANYSESLVVTENYTIQPPAAQPLFMPAGGTYTSPQFVTITDTTPGAVIHYTTDGTTPSLSSPVFNPASPIMVTSSGTIKALAIVPGYATSPEAAATYTIAALAPVISPPTDFYFPPISVTITDGTPNAVIRYTTDGTTPTATSPVYGGTFTVTSPERVRAIATAPNLAPSAVTSADFDVMSAAAQPIISLPSGTYTGPQMVMITDATPGAVIYYTTNGTTPSRSSAVYSSGSPIMATSSQTIKALAVATGYSTSPEAVCVYNITPSRADHWPRISLNPLK